MPIMSYEKLPVVVQMPNQHHRQTWYCDVPFLTRILIQPVDDWYWTWLNANDKLHQYPAPSVS